MAGALTRYVHSGGAHVAYQVVDDGDLDIVLVPGWFSHVELGWEMPGLGRLLRSLSEVGRLILFDKRGTGMSDHVPHDELPSLDERTEDIFAVMDAVGSQQAALIGVSEGGAQSILAAARHPERVSGVVAIDSWACLLEHDDFDIGLPQHLLESTMARMVSSWGSGEDIKLFLPSRRDDELVRSAWATLERRAASPGAVATYGRMLLDLDVRAVLEKVVAPTLVMHSCGDKIVPVAQGRSLAEHILDARFVELPGDDHIPWFDNLGTVLAEIESFLTGRVQTHHVEHALATVVITDIVGSTGQAAAEGDRRWRERLDAYESLAMRVVSRYGGRIVKSTGDGTLASFDQPRLALDAARALNAELAPVGVDVRTGVHCGQVEVRGDDLGGIAVHIAARIVDRAGPGEVLVSGTVRDLLLGSDLTFEDRGKAELRGVPGTWQLYGLD